MKIHPTAIIDPGAKLGQDVAVGPYAVIERDVILGDGCIVGAQAVVCAFTTIGARTQIHPHAVIGDTPQDLSFKPGVASYVEIGEDCVLREGVTIHRGAKEGTKTTIGHHCFLMSNSHVGHNGHVGNHVIMANGVLLAGHVEVGDRVFLGGNSAVHQFCRVGRLAIVGGLSATSQDIPPFCMTETGGRNTLSGLNVVGLRRAGFSPADRQAIRRAYKALFRSGLNLQQALEQLRAGPMDPLVAELADFMTASKRGVCRASQTSGEDDE